MFFQDSYPLDKYFLKKSYIASLLWRQDLIQPRLDLNLYLRINLVLLPPPPPKCSDYSMRHHPSWLHFRRLDFK